MNKFRNIDQITRFKNPEESPGYLLWHVSLCWRSLIEKALKEFNLTHPQFVILMTISWLTKKGEHINQIDISKASGLDPNTTSSILRLLEKKNFIKRIRSVNEKSKNPQLTQLGQDIVKEALPAVEKTDSNFFEILTSQDIDKLIKIFQKMVLS